LLFKNELSIFFAFLALTNPLTTVPLLLAATEQSTTAERRRTVLVANVSAAIILFVSLFVGQAILTAFQIEIDAFRIAGGLLIASVAWAMATGKPSTLATSGGGRSAAVVPLAIPSLAGPGAIAAAIELGHAAPGIGIKGADLLALLLVCVVNAVVLLGAAPIERTLGEQGMKVISRVLGLILLGIAISGILKALDHFYPAWGGS
jgi:multiple antibiotic resistance protein